jgi:hypothetical protein
MNKQLKSLVIEIVVASARFDKYSKKYVCDVNDVARHDVSQIARLLFAADNNGEAITQSDRIMRMVNAALSNPSKENELELGTLMVNEINDYYRAHIQELIDDAVMDMNAEFAA